MAFNNCIPVRGCLLLVCFIVSISMARSQGRQVKMYLEQIAANKVYIEYLQKGYTIVKQGLNVIGSIKNGHFSLDQLFFNGLVSINPRVRQYPRVADIIVLAVRITSTGNKSMQQLRRDGLFTGDLLQYAGQVTTALNADCVALLADLAELLTTGELQLSDDERIKRIDQVYQEMSDRYVFVSNWSAETSMLGLQKKKDQQEASRMKSVYGLK